MTLGQLADGVNIYLVIISTVSPHKQIPEDAFAFQAAQHSTRPRDRDNMLDARGLSGWIPRMKIKIFLSLIVALAVVTGCSSTQTGRKVGAVPFVKDSVEGRYERSQAQVYIAAKEVVIANGVLQNEVTLHGTNNAVVLAIEGRVQERKVFIGVKEVSPQVTSVTVQVRTSAGGRDLDVAHEIEKQIGIKLATR